MMTLRGLKTLCFILSTLLLVSCGGSGDGGSENVDDDGNSEAVKKAYFVDSAVQGLAYASASYQGITDIHGGFKYEPGETTSFSFKGLQLGSVLTPAGSSTFTPLDLFGTNDVNNQAVKNTLVLLQSLDDDQNPDNGITLPVDSNLIELSALSISSGDFQPQLLARLEPFKNALVLVSEAEALAHFDNTIIELNTIPDIEGRWIMRDTAHGDVSAVYEFMPDNALRLTEFDDCLQNDTYWTATESSARRNCVVSEYAFSYQQFGNHLDMFNDDLDDDCRIISSSPHLILASCEFQGSGLGTELVRFERDLDDPSESLASQSYQEFVGGSLNYSDYAFDPLLTTVFLQDVGGAVTINDGTHVLIPEFDSGLAAELIEKQVWGVYDAVNGQCKKLYNFNIYDGGSQLPLGVSANGGSNSDKCEVPAEGLVLPALPISDGDPVASVSNGALVIEQGAQQEICWPVSIAHMADDGEFAVVACSANGSTFGFEIWRNLFGGGSIPGLPADPPVNAHEAADQHTIPKSGPPGLRQTLFIRTPIDANIQNIKAFMRNGSWPESECLNFVEAGFFYPMDLHGAEGAWTKVENTHVYELPDQRQKIIKSEFVNWSHCNTRTGRLTSYFFTASDDFGGTQNEDGSWVENWTSFQLGEQICEDRFASILNCQMIGDAGYWLVAEYKEWGGESPPPLTAGGEYLKSVEIVKDAANDNSIKLTTLPNNAVAGAYGASLIHNFVFGIPVTPNTELFFEGYEDVIGEDIIVTISLGYKGVYNGNDPCKAKQPVYIFGNSNFDPSAYPEGNIMRDAVVIGPTESFSRKIFQDLSCAESEYEIGVIRVEVSTVLREQPNPPPTSGSVTISKIGIRQ